MEKIGLKVMATILIVSSSYQKKVFHNQTGSSAEPEKFVFRFFMIDFYSPGCLLSESAG